jgi:hypothetical protein
MKKEGRRMNNNNRDVKKGEKKGYHNLKVRYRRIGKRRRRERERS